MPAVPADVLAKLEPYFSLGRKLGSFAAQITEGPVKEIVVGYAGELADVDTQPLTRHIVQGVLSYHLGAEQVNAVNAMHLAKKREVNIVVNQSTASKGFTNLVTVTLRSAKEERMVAGALLNGFGARITQIDKYPVDVEPQGHHVLISHNDKPGIIGRVGTLLGTNDINIATMQVGRKIVGGAAIMVLGVDKAVPKDVLAQLEQLPDLVKAKEVQLI
jgi:D-3-phosphoglycerate dehydrogenase